MALECSLSGKSRRDVELQSVPQCVESDVEMIKWAIVPEIYIPRGPLAAGIGMIAIA